MATSPPPAKPSTRRPPISTSATQIIDDGNLKAGLLHKKNRGKPCRSCSRCTTATTNSLKGLTTAAGMLPGLMMAGTKKHDRQALREELESLGVRIRPARAAGSAVAAADVAAAAVDRWAS